MSAEPYIEEHDSGIARSLHHPDPPGSVPAIRDIPIEEVNRVLFRTPGRCLSTFQLNLNHKCH